MSATNYILPYLQAVTYAEKFIEKIQENCTRIEFTGQLRRECKECNYVELIATPKMEQGTLIYFDEGKQRLYSKLDMFFVGFPGMEQDGKKRKILHYPKYNLKIIFYLSTPETWGKDLCWSTGNNSFYSQHIATAWNRKGWCTVNGELRKKKECEHIANSNWHLKPLYETGFSVPPSFLEEIDLFDFLEMPYIEPNKRNW